METFINHIEKILKADDRLLSKDKDKKLLSSVTLKRLNLSEKNYWAIYFHPKDENTLGGDGWFFVDKDSGCLIGYFLGE